MINACVAVSYSQGDADFDMATATLQKATGTSTVVNAGHN